MRYQPTIIRLSEILKEQRTEPKYNYRDTYAETVDYLNALDLTKQEQEQEDSDDEL